MSEVKYDHKKKNLASALGLTEERFKELTEKVGFIGFLAKCRTEALEIIKRDKSITEEEKFIASYLLGNLLAQV